MRSIIAITVALFVGANVHGQDNDIVAALQKMNPKVFAPDSAEAKLRSDSIKQLREDVNKRDVEAWRKIKTKADWEAFRDEHVAALRKSLGTFPQAPKNVKVVVTKKIQGEGFTIENILYESRPGFYVTANLYVPEKTDQPMPGFIVVHSHHNPKTQGELQDMGILWAKQGCLVLVPDMLGHGERRQHPFVDAKSYPEKYEVSRQDYRFRYNNALQLHLVGESLVGWMVWDLMRGVDVLYQRPNLDKSKVMVFGSVAGGGDPCAVFAALDPRVTASAPFNFGGPQPESPKLGQDAEFAFNYMGGGSWESTRNLKLSAKGGFLPWLIGGSIAPRGLVYGHEFAWDKDRDPVWARFNTIWGFYDAKDKLAASAGRGSVKGKPPESTHCNNIGYEHRKPIYPTLTKWFGLPIPEENKKRYLSSELQCWTDDARQTLKPKTMLETIAQMETRRMVWLNDPDLKSLYVRLSPVVGEDMAKFVILYREYGPTNLAPNPRVQVSRLSDYQFPPKFRQGNYSLASPLDLIGSGVAITRMEGIRTVRRIYECPLNDKTKWPDLLPKLFAGTTLYDPAETSEPRERINVASASPQELAKLNLSDADIQKIITVRRGLTAAELETPAWLITEAQISLRAIGDRTFFASITSKAPTDPQKQWLRLLGVNASADLPCKVEWLADTTLPGKHFVGIGVFRQEGKPALAVPVVTIRPAGAKGKIPVVIALAQEGKAGFFKHRAETIAKLLEGGVAVCLPDLRGTGETAADGRGRQSGGTSYSASLLMHGQTAPGVQLQELVMVIRELPKQGFGNIALWGDSFAEPNDPKTEFAKPYDVSNMPRQSEPMGGTLALLGGLFGGDSVKAIYVRGGMVSFKSMLDSPFCYFPHDAVIPGVLPASDLPTLAEAHAKRGLRLEALVDGLNRRVDDKTLKAAYRAAMFSRPAHDLMVLREQPSSAAEVAAWLAGRVKR